MDEFYKNLKHIDTFTEIFREDAYQDVPADWWIALTDVIGSTKAIEEGRYKEVNSAGSLPVMAISNHLGGMEFPFLFGGDGMTCMIPSQAVPAVKDILIGTAKTVEQAFQLSLRIALIPVKDLINQGKTLRIACFTVSNHYTQAIFDGDGFDYAEVLLKQDNGPYSLSSDLDAVYEPDFSGYSCRWQDFPSPQDETIALLVKFRKKDPSLIQNFLLVMNQIIGNENDHHPLRYDLNKPAFDTRRLNLETAVFTGKKKGFRAFFYRNLMRFQILSVLFISLFRIPVYWGKKDLSRTKAENITSCDFRKYDNSIKMILAVSENSRKELQKVLESNRQSGNIFYGLHVSNRAMLTCLMHTATGGEVHFVDAADGGYAMASKQLKEQIKESKE